MNDITQFLYAIALFLVSIGFHRAWVIELRI